MQQQRANRARAGISPVLPTSTYLAEDHPRPSYRAAYVDASRRPWCAVTTRTMAGPIRLPTSAATVDPTPLLCPGTRQGRILFSPRSENGFGYDPVFYVPTHDCSSAELPPEIKNSLSHRGQALRKLIEELRG